MSGWRRRSMGAAALLVLLSAPTLAVDDVSVTLEDGSVVVVGLPDETLGRLAGDFDDWSSILQVKVSGAGNSVLGDYEIVSDKLVFRPMFPFDPGRRYLVYFAVDDIRVQTDVGLPPRDLTPITVITQIYPSGDVLPENQLKLYIHFSEPMASGDGLPFVKLIDVATGEEVVDPFLPLGDAFWNHDHRRYTVFFDPGRVKRGILPNEQMGRPILDGREYELVIDPAWRDAFGRALAEPHRKRFRAGPPDETPLDIDDWTIHAPAAGTREPLVVDFGESLDHGVMGRSLLVAYVGGDVEITENESRWSLTPDRPWIATRYVLTVRGELEDLAGNQIGKRFEVDVFERIDSPEDIPDYHEIEIDVR